MNNYLVIDDDRLTRQALTWLIESEGHGCTSAETIEDAVCKLNGRPSHVILDLHLGDGDGIKVLRHIRSQNLPIRVAVLSGTDDEMVLSEAQNLEADEVFRKPEWAGLSDWISHDGLSDSAWRSCCHTMQELISHSRKNPIAAA